MSSSDEPSVAAAPVEPKSLNDKISSHLPKFPLSPQIKVTLSNLLFIIVFIQSIPAIILIIKVWKSGKTGGLVIWAFIIQIIVSIFWILYGFSISNFLIMMASTLLVIANITLVVLIIRTRKKEKENSDTCPECCRLFLSERGEEACSICLRPMSEALCDKGQLSASSFSSSSSNSS